MKDYELHAAISRMEGSLANYRAGLTPGTDLLASLTEFAILIGWDMYYKILSKELKGNDNDFS